MQRFFNISQLWKKSGISDTASTKEAGEQGGPSFNHIEESSSGGLAFIRPPPSNVSTSTFLFALNQRVEQHFSLSEISSTNEVPEGENQSRHKIERIQHFLRVLRSSPATDLPSGRAEVCGTAASTLSSSGAPDSEKNCICAGSEVAFSVGKEEETTDVKKSAYFTALTLDRKFLEEALNNCLIEIPDQRLKCSIAEKKKCDTPVHPVEKDHEKTPIQEKEKKENEEERKSSEHSAEEQKSAVGDTSGIGTEKEKRTVSIDVNSNESSTIGKTSEKNDLEPQKEAAPSVSSTSSTSADSSKNFDFLDWRRLLLKITEILIAVDACLYFELFQRGKWLIISRRTSLDAIPSLPTPTEPPSTASAPDSSTSLSITLMNSVTSRRKKNTDGSKAGTRETQGSTGVNRFASESHKMIEDLLNRISSIATWVTVRSVLQHQIAALQKDGADTCGKSDSEGHLIVDGVSGVSEKRSGGSHISTSIPPTSAIAPLIDWRGVLTDLKNIFQGEFECMMEAILSAAFLRGHVKEMMSCFIQEPTPQKVLQDALSFKEGKQHKEDLSFGSPLATKIGDAHSITSHLGGSSRSSSVLSGSSCGISNSSGIASGGRTYGSVTPPGNAVGSTISTSNSSSRPLVLSVVGELNHVRPSSPTLSSISNTNATGSGSIEASSSILKARSPKHKPPPIAAPLLATSSAVPSAELTDFLTRISIEDLDEEVEADYQHHVVKSLSEYFESVFFSSTSESHKTQNIKEKLSSTDSFSAENKNAVEDEQLLHDTTNTAEKENFLSVRVFPQLAATYFCCSNGWSVESREKRFQMLEELEARSGAKERRPEWSTQLSSPPPHAETPLSSAQSESQVSPLANSSAVENVEVPHFPPPITSEQAEQELLQSIKARILSMSWTSALHRRVEQCIAARPPALFSAKKYCEKEVAEAEVLSSFHAKQQALTSIINYSLAAGLSQEARQYSLRHFDKEKKEWTQSYQTPFSAVRYLESMVQLAQANAACEDNKGVVETVQTLILQANLCDALLEKSVPPLSQNNVIRFSELRSTVLRSRVIYLREGWRSHIALKSGKDAFYFEEYLLALRQLRSCSREIAVFEAQMECGHQFMKKMDYNEAAEHFLVAVKLAKRDPVVMSSSSSRTSTEAEFQPHSITKSSSYRSAGRLSVTGFGNLITDEEHADHEQKENKAADSMWRLAESERLFALACVSQAEQEVSVPDRRLKLNLAVNHAYAAQGVLLKWQAKGSVPRSMWTAAPSNLIVNGRALLLLNQPKKVVLLLEPLVEDKPTSAAIRPPMWREALRLRPEVLTAEDIVRRMDWNSVTIDVFQLYAQCIVRFDVKKALCVVGQVRQLLFRGAQWIEAVRNLILEADVEEDLPSTAEISQALRMSWTPTDEHFRPLLGSGEKEELAGGVNRRSEEIAEKSVSHHSLSPQVPINQSENSLRVALKSKSEESQALGALERGSWYICRALRDLEITKGDAFCKLKLWKSAFFTFWRLVYLMKNPIAAEWSFTERFSPSHYRASGGLATETPTPSAFSQEKNSEYAALSGLSSEWCVQLLSDEELTSPTALMEDPLLSGSRAEFSDEVDNMDRDGYLVKLMMEEEKVDHRTAAILILSKLATVLQAMGEIDKSIQYHMKVVEYSMKMKSKLLEYKSSLELARLYTSIHASEESQSMWESVSELAREYGDQEVARETMRNLITAQEASQRFFNVIESAEELHELARAAEGAEAAADTRFALEALAKAHLELDQYDECLTALDEREKVQENNGEWSGKLFEMRSRALIGQGRFAESVKVLSSYLVKAKQLKKFDEVGNALSCLAKTFVVYDLEIRAQECYIESILAFSQLPVLNAEVKKAILAAARWLVNDFYLSNKLVDANRVAGKTIHSSNDADKLVSNNGPHGRPGTSSSSCPAAMEELKNVSGNLEVIFREEELRRVALLSAARGGEEQEGSTLCKKSATACSGEAILSPIKRQSSWKDVVIENDTNNDAGGMRSNHHEDAKLVSPVVLVGRKSSLSAGAEALAMPERPACEKVGNLGNALLCRRPAALAPRKEDAQAATSLEDGHPPHVPSEDVTPQADPFFPSVCAQGAEGLKGMEKEAQQLMVSTKSFVRALAVIEWCTQLLVQRTPYTALSPCAYAPAEAVNFALMMHRNSAFVFFFAQYASGTGRYNIIIRPPKSSFFITEQAELLNTIAFPQIFSSSSACQPLEDDHGFRYADLKMLSEDLWDPVRKAFEKAHSRIDQASCMFIVPDTSLYNVPFGALGASYAPQGGQSKGRKSIRKPPLGAQCPLVVTLTLTHLVSSGMIRDRACTGLLKGKQFFRYAALFDDVESESVQNPKEIISVAKRMVLGRTATLPTVHPAFRPRVPQEREPLKSLPSWTISPTLSKARLVKIFRDRSTKMVLLGSPSCAGNSVIKACDGTVSCEDILSSSSSLIAKKSASYTCQHIELAILQNDIRHIPTAEKPGLAVKLVLNTHCARVLRVENVFGGGLCLKHRKLIVRYFTNLEKVLKFQLNYPFALALQMTMKEAWEEGLPVEECCVFTLVGAP